MLTNKKISNLIFEHETWRARCMNLIASENALSPAVRKALDNDLVQRYGNYAGRDLTDRRYTGNKYLQEIEIGLEDIVREVFGAQEIELRAISGHVAGLSVIMATTKPGDTVLEISGTDGGHRLAEKAAESPLIDLKVLPLPFNPHLYNIDAKAACMLIKEVKPKLVILGSSNFLFPNPIQEIAACLAEFPEMVLAYDASHVLGLIACGDFQDPLKEGAHVMFGSTHKTLPGPQGGLILSNDATLMDRVSRAVYPGTVTNHHLMRSPALAIALNEMQSNPGYAQNVIANAQALGTRLAERGIPIVAYEQGVTSSHTVLVETEQFGRGKNIAQTLEAADIMTSYTGLPEALGGEGIRLGTAEVTRLGAGEPELRDAADIIASVLNGEKKPSEVLNDVHGWVGQLPGIKFPGK